ADDTGFPLEFVCRSFCRGDSACGPGERCVAIGAGTPQDGICLPGGCALFDPSCGAAATCEAALLVDRQRFTGLCRSVGMKPLPPGADCTNGECGATALCIPDRARDSFFCAAACDDAHPCATGTCKPFDGLTNGAGSCPLAAARPSRSPRRPARPSPWE